MNEELAAIVAECNRYRDKLKATLEENTRLAEKVPHWISVKDGLPEEYTDVLLMNKRGVSIGECTSGDTEKSYWRGRQGRSHSLSTVTHWMPLPEPPKEEKAMKTVIAEKDGNAFVAHYDDFINLQESPAGYGDTPEEAKEMLYAESEGGNQCLRINTLNLPPIASDLTIKSRIIVTEKRFTGHIEITLTAVKS